MKEVNFGAWLKWFLIFMLSTLGFMVYYSTGLFWKVYEADITYICHIITVVFFYFSIRVGCNTFNACIDISKGSDEEEPYMDKGRYKYWSRKLRKYYRYNDMGWFVANHLPTLGLLGTLIGMSYVFLFSGVDMSTQAGQAMIFKGMGTALYTTIMGTICSLLLKKQLFNLKYFMDEKTGKTNGV